MAAASDALKTAQAALQDQRYFDGVQIVNGALEVQQGLFTKIQSGGYATSTDKQEILKNPVLPELTESKRKLLADLFVLRTDLLMGLGALKRAVLDISAALLLAPEDEAMAKKKSDIEGLLKTGMSASEGSAKTPTTIITGFLGAGKTTLLNYILDANHGKKIAIIENEFGEVGIDDSLLNTKSSVTEENVIEMNNGCICCTVRGDLIAGLKKLHKQTTGKGKPLDGIIIETTGLADPAPVAQTFFADEFVSANMMLDGILTVVDSKHIVGQLQEAKPQGAVNEAVEQIAFADRILLNKTDLVDEPALEKVESEIRRINKTAAIRKTQNSRVDMEFILGIQAFSLEKVLMQISQSVEEEADAHGHGHHGHNGHEGHESHEGHSHSHGHGEDCKECDHSTHKRHDYRVSSVGIQRDKEVQKDKLDSFISWLVQNKGPDLYRSKGVLAVRGMPQKFVFHAVHMQFSGRQHEAWGPDEKRQCKMVFIGKNLDREELNKRFDECLVK
eukprot:s2163_g4.t1